jgi:phosphoglycolate phosphatase-like HAD superfamily hydrolase
MRILLWDIDGTLVNTGGAGMKALARAVAMHPAAAQALQRMRLDGMTDHGIARLLCGAARHRNDPDRALEEHVREVSREEIERVLAVYLQHLRDSMPTAERYRVLPGVVAALDATDRAGAVQGLGTGNVEEGAQIKLEHRDLWRRFRFGGYGSDAEERAAIIGAAKVKAEALLGRACAPEEFVVIGDTPRDVAAAHANGFACVAVASGSHPAAELVAHHADDVLASLEDEDAAGRILRARRRA